jgi:hypothetical protein
MTDYGEHGAQPVDEVDDARELPTVDEVLQRQRELEADEAESRETNGAGATELADDGMAPYLDTGAEGDAPTG